MGFMLGLFTGVLFCIMYAGAARVGEDQGAEPRVTSTPCETSGLPNKDEAGRKGQ